MNDFNNAIKYIDNLCLIEPDDKIVGFMILYMVFNQNFKNRDENCDADKFQGYFIEVAKQYVEDNSQKIQDGFARTAISGRRDRVKDMNSTTGRTVKILKDNQFMTAQLAKVIYQIRCNLFHGSKDLSSEDEQKLVAWAYDILLGVAEVIK